jgi:hypothetical protein
MKYPDLTMWFDELDYSAIVSFLKKEAGLVPPNNVVFSSDEGPLTHKLVGEVAGRGVYRVDYLEEREALYFRYWGKDRVTPEISEEDPMLDTMRKVYDKFKPKRCTVGGAIILSEVNGRP